ncbi:precorrin-2 C(20)-methyltransferase [Desulfotomaculum copahuensis]|uniref:Precorrin-2 C(20)-methyltransferase n=1 Tax=Desulfotomaculum copahuensis TaxID=1838280 RepID=A0A1B7LC73_9FIRM|nr:precorrin-2 C(20)-methyltransferase [Desulfotomaculum copahuensis]OAT80269.1 precorrin-2 C(20)-methyltransferase [Desulfotomaculum copahuensis]
MPGKFYGIGVGPGDPELLTLKARRILESADLVCVPRSAADRESLALFVVSRALQKEVPVLELSFPMTKDRSTLLDSWARAGETVAARVREGKQVAFITIGDPMFYSTYGYLLRHLQRHHPDMETETVPGVTAMSACAAALQEPLTEGEETLAVIPAAYGVEQLSPVLERFDNVVLMKVHRHFDQVLSQLESQGLAAGAVLVSRCGYPDQTVHRELSALKGQKLDYMSLLMIRKRKGEAR